METLCTHCGNPLKDGARYCNLCGTLVPSHPLSPKAASSSPSRAAQFDSPAMPMAEQIAQRPPQRSSRLPSQDEPPSWMRQLDNRTRTARKTAVEHQDVTNVPQLDFPIPEPPARTNSSTRVEVWAQDAPVVPLAPENPSLSEMGAEADDLPTRPLAASIPEKAEQRHTPAPPLNKQQGVDELERLDTVPLATQKGMKPMALPVGEPFQRQGESRRQQMSSFGSPVNPHAPVGPRASVQSVQDLRQTPPPQASVPAKKRRRSRKPLVITLVVLLALVLASGIGAWVVLYQPFSVPVVTQPQQTLTSSQLGLSLLYPSAWKPRVDQGTASVQLSDSSHTAQVNIIASPANGEDLGQYLQQEAGRLGLTGQKKATALSFAGTSWQQIQGSVLLKGASYTETLLATVHHQRVYSIILLAPQSTYAQEDQLVFSRVLASFEFLS